MRFALAGPFSKHTTQHSFEFYMRRIIIRKSQGSFSEQKLIVYIEQGPKYASGHGLCLRVWVIGSFI